MVEFNILDVGCGKNKRGDIGIDYSRDSEADVIADAHFLPFIDGVFDGVVSNHVIEHSPNPLTFLREQYRILKNNGKLTLVTDNAQYFRFSVLSFRLYGTRHEDYPDHYMIFYPKNIVKLMKMCGFQNIRTEYQFLPTKLAIMAGLFVKIGIFRKQSLYCNFKIKAQKLEC